MQLIQKPLLYNSRIDSDVGQTEILQQDRQLIGEDIKGLVITYNIGIFPFIISMCKIISGIYDRGDELIFLRCIHFSK